MLVGRPKAEIDERSKIIRQAFNRLDLNLCARNYLPNNLGSASSAIN